jgi:hypothetical protein
MNLTLMNYCVQAFGQTSCGKQFNNQAMITMWLVSIISISFIVWCFYDLFKGDENGN